MLFAINEEGLRISPYPGTYGLCPMCKQKVISKCGQIITWHWAHQNIADCDSWNDAETDWHYNWKKRFPENNCEVIIENHRADIVTQFGEVIELQNSYISPEEIQERELFYKNMVWIFNVQESAKNIEFRSKPGKSKSYASFRWKYPKKNIAYTTKPTILDTGDKLFVLEKMFKATPCGGWGYFISIDELLSTQMFNGNYRFNRIIDPRKKWFDAKEQEKQDFRISYEIHTGKKWMGE